MSSRRRRTRQSGSVPPVRPPSRRVFVAYLLAWAVTAMGCSRPSEDYGLVGVRPYKYGESPSQIGELTVPNRLGPHPVVVLIHGGWWRAEDFDRTAMRELARAISAEGFAAWNLEYRLVGEPGGGWPGTFEDVARGIDALREHAPTENLDLGRVVVVGHSAGGHLALWAAKRSDLPPGAPGASPKVVPKAVVALNPITDLAAAAEANLGGGAVQQLMGGPPSAHPERYALASPSRLLPLPVPQRLFHATRDPVVPVEQSRRFVAAAQTAGSDAVLVELDDSTHFDVIAPDRPSWKKVESLLKQILS
ncbi:MAG: hypothetical protein KatS3mg008_0955 [Acidimicrobiales bacterium]|nr:MAG: hypothetical protein KatS3mg008_0955 [Acidimicrobiales bacterium]